MDTHQAQLEDGHPKGLYVLFASEAWERFSFYSMLALFTLYLRDEVEGFGWTEAESISLYSWYLTFVYASPIVGGLLADRYFGYFRTTAVGALFFVAGHFLLAFHSITIVYVALGCLVIGNGLFKPNVSTMVGNLYPERSPLKDQAFIIFYFGINVGAFAAGLVMELLRQWMGFHVAFAAAGVGMVISLVTLYTFREHIKITDFQHSKGEQSNNGSNNLADIPEWRRVMALTVVFLLVIVFWMAFHQNGSTLTFWADDNTDSQFSGTIFNSINPFWILVLSFPLVKLWGWLGKRKMEPSTPTKMALGMLLTGLSFFILYAAAKLGEASVTGSDIYDYQMSPLWLIASYGVVTLGELLLSPMGLSLVSKVAPFRLRGLMMGGWFLATAIGNKLTAIGLYWTIWPHSTFFAALGVICIGMSVLFMLIIKPLKRELSVA